MSIIEVLLFTSRHGALLELLEMVLLPPVRCKITQLVGVARVNKIKFPYSWQCILGNVNVRHNNIGLRIKFGT
jgi:hypothetical protein